MEMNPPPTPPTKKQIRFERAAQTRQKSRETVLLALLPVVFFIGLGLGWLLRGITPSPSKAEIVIDADDYVLGPDDAPITIIEFSDYQCPYCALWHEQVYKRLMQEYEGKIRFVYRDFPLNGHPDAAPAAMAANCAGEQGAYYPFHDALFSTPDNLGREAYLQHATALGLEMVDFETCLDEERYASEVQADLQYAFSIGVSSTPTFFINGQGVVGAQPYEVFKQAIEKELAGNQ